MREVSSRAGWESSEVTEALMEVSGVRNSWATESSSALRRRSLSCEASERAEFELDFVGVELGHLDGLLDEVVEAVGLFVDDGEEFGAGSVVEGRLGEQRGD